MTRIRQYEMTAGQWTSQNPVLLKGEIGWESGVTTKAKKGDGSTPWNSLPYWLAPDAAYAPLASPLFTGNPRAPTPSVGDDDTSLATTAFVQNELDYYAKLVSPAFTGNPTAPTPATADNDTSLATTAFVKAQAYAPLASPVLTGDPKAPTPATADNDTSIATTAFVKAQAYAPLASPVLTGSPTAPTPSPGDNDTSIATTAFVAAIAARSVYAQAVGQVAIAGASVATGGEAHAAITFPVGRFTQIPRVQCVLTSAAGGTAMLVARVAAITTTGAIVYLYNLSAGDLTWASAAVDWIASQGTSAASNS